MEGVTGIEPVTKAWEYRRTLYISCGCDRYLHVFSKTETDGNGADRDVTSNLCLPQFLTTDEFVLSGPLGGVHRTDTFDARIWLDQ